jgi:hypothetical protein
VGEHTVEVEVAADWDDDDRLVFLHQALRARPELLEPSVGADRRRRVIGAIVTVQAPSESAARDIAGRAVLDERRGSVWPERRTARVTLELELTRFRRQLRPRCRPAPSPSA